jgi:hypothetical protein
MTNVLIYNNNNKTLFIPWLYVGKKFSKQYSHMKVLIFRDDDPNSYNKPKIYSRFNYPLDNLPQGLVCLSLGTSYNHPLDKLPKGLIELSLGGSYNHPLDKLPKGLKNLTIGKSYNHPLDKLPKQLKKLIIKSEFNYFLDNLPEKLEELIINHPFNNSVDKLPKELKKLSILSIYFNHHIDNLPDQLNFLQLSSDSFDFPINNLPAKLTKLILNIKKIHPIINLPENLLECSLNFLGCYKENHIKIYNYDMVFRDNFYSLEKIIKLPNKLTHLSLCGRKFTYQFQYLPSSLQHLTLNYGTFPDEFLNIQHLTNLTHLNLLNHSLDYSIDNLPDNITNLSLLCFNIKPINKFPNSLHKLKILSNFPFYKIPYTVEKLVIISTKLSDNFNQSTIVFPQTLKQISCCTNILNHTNNLKGFKIPFGCLIKKKSKEKINMYLYG